MIGAIGNALTFKSQKQAVFSLVYPHEATNAEGRVEKFSFKKDCVHNILIKLTLFQYSGHGHT